MSDERTFAFRCKTCGHFETSGNAGEREFPAACTTCGSGVSFDPATGIKQYADAENWEVLNDLTATQKKSIDVPIVAHTPTEPTADREPQNIDRTTEDSLGAEDVI